MCWSVIIDVCWGVILNVCYRRNIGCVLGCNMGCVLGCYVDSEEDIGNACSNSSRIRYIYLRINTVEKF